MITLIALQLYLVDCTKPRLDFRSFYTASTNIRWPGMYGEDMYSVHRRVLESIADYTDYVVQYRETCK